MSFNRSYTKVAVSSLFAFFFLCPLSFAMAVGNTNRRIDLFSSTKRRHCVCRALRDAKLKSRINDTTTEDLFFSERP